MSISSPGAAFAAAFATDRERTEVQFGFTITDAFQPTKDRPRVTVRNLFKIRPVSGAGTRFWCEGRSPASEVATILEGVAVHLPTHFFHVRPAVSR